MIRFVCVLFGILQFSLAFSQNVLRLAPSPAAWLAYTTNTDGNYEIYRMLPNGSQQQRLTFNDTHDWMPIWRQDRQWLVYLSYLEGIFEVFMMEADGSVHEALTRSAERQQSNQYPAWSPDGQSIVYLTSFDLQQTFHMMRASFTDKSRTEIETEGLSPNIFAWSNSGDWIAFTSFRESGWQIYRVRPSGVDLELLLDARGAVSSVAWSPDDRTLAFMMQTGSSTYGLFLLDMETKSLQNIVDGVGWIHTIDWSPDGEQLVFSTWGQLIQEVYQVRRNGGELVRIANSALYPQWSPDGRWVTYVQRGPNDDDAIYRYHVGSRQHDRLTTAHGLYETPVWSTTVDRPYSQWNMTVGIAIAVVGLVFKRINDAIFSNKPFDDVK